MHPSALPDDVLLAECDLGRGRASGPGGQHRNKVETAVTLTHRPTGVIARASERRSQVENKRVALRRLRLKLATDFRLPSPPGRGAGGEGSRLPLSPGERGPGGEGRRADNPRPPESTPPDTRLGGPRHPDTRLGEPGHPDTRLGEPGHHGSRASKTGQPDGLAFLDAGSDLWRSRRRGRRIVVSPEHRDYPALLAEALDAIAAAGWDPAPAAARLGVTPSQLIKLVKDHRPAFELWNAERAKFNHHLLK